MRTIQCLAFALAASLLVITSAQAADAVKGCYQKDYAKAWLKKTPKQFITSIQIDVAKGESSSSRASIKGDVRVRFRDDTEIWWQSRFVCFDGGPSWACSMDCEGGTFTLSNGKNGLQLNNQSFLRFHETDSCETKPRDIFADREHTVFIMPLVKSKPCEK